MQYKFFKYSTLLLALVLVVTSCKKDEESVSILKNDCIKRSLGPNVVGQTIEFAYAMALPYDTTESATILSAQVEASIAGATGTYMENNSYYTNGSGVDVGIQVGSPSVTTDKITSVTFTRDTCAATLRYYYVIPEEAKGKQVTFTFSATAANGETVTYSMGPYVVANMDMKLDMVLTDNAACFLSVEDMKAYTAAEAAANPDKIDLVYLYRSITGISFNHALASPAADTAYLRSVTLPAGVNKSTKVNKVWALRDRHLARLQYGVYIDDIDFKQLDLSASPNYAINLRAESGAWVETADGKYRAYLYVNSVNNTARSMTVSIKRLVVQ